MDNICFWIVKPAKVAGGAVLLPWLTRGRGMAWYVHVVSYLSLLAI